MISRNKKGYMRTLEAFIAVILTFAFMMYVVPQFSGGEKSHEAINVFESVLDNKDFRNCVLESSISSAETCVYNLISDSFPLTYAYSVEISENTDFEAKNLPDTKIYSESVMVAGNMSMFSPRYVKIYYWVDETKSN